MLCPPLEESVKRGTVTEKARACGRLDLLCECIRPTYHKIEEIRQGEDVIRSYLHPVRELL